MIEVDARGLSCPLPVLRTKKALSKQPEEVSVLVDARVQVENVSRLAVSLGYQVTETREESDCYRLILRRVKSKQ
jgi:tRNA 2-thiouridine synthesizing protein A